LLNAGTNHNHLGTSNKVSPHHHLPSQTCHPSDRTLTESVNGSLHSQLWQQQPTQAHHLAFLLDSWQSELAATYSLAKDAVVAALQMHAAPTAHGTICSSCWAQQ